MRAPLEDPPPGHGPTELLTLIERIAVAMEAQARFHEELVLRDYQGNTPLQSILRSFDNISSQLDEIKFDLQESRRGTK